MRRVLVTGGASGIGYNIATSFKKAGYKVCVACIESKEKHKQLEDYDISAIQWDVADFEACKNKIAEAESKLGGNVEILVNNAGITRDGMFHKQSRENWDAVINVNLSSVFNMSRVVIEKMRENKFGRIVSMSSVNAHGMMGQTNYAASKAGIEGFTKTLALEGARYGITANAVAPGYVNTEMVAAIPKEALDKIVSVVPMNRLAEVSEISRVVLFLAAEESSFITGAVIPVNGGLRLY